MRTPSTKSSGSLPPMAQSGHDSKHCEMHGRTVRTEAPHPESVSDHHGHATSGTTGTWGLSSRRTRPLKLTTNVAANQR